MSIKANNFIEVNINHHISSKANSTREEAVLISYEKLYKAEEMASTYKSLSSKNDVSDNDKYYKYAKAFFENGGKVLHVYDFNHITDDNGDDATIDAKYATVLGILNDLPMEQIMVGFTCTDADLNLTLVDDEAELAEIANYYNSNVDTKAYQKIFVTEIITTDTTEQTRIESLKASYTDASGNKIRSIENYVIKYGMPSIGASVLAYYTTINAYSINATQDYAFTTENYTTEGFVFDDNELVKTIMALDMNIDGKLVGKVKSIGGSDTAGYPLTNQFMLLLVHQVITESLLNVVSNKIRYDSYGINTILNTVTSELNEFVGNGYLSTDKVWTDPDLYYKGYEIIKQNTVLNTGFKVNIIPSNDAALNKMPDIYILLADTYPIRKIVISGEIF